MRKARRYKSKTIPQVALLGPNTFGQAWFSKLDEHCKHRTDSLMSLVATLPDDVFSWLHYAPIPLAIFLQMGDEGCEFLIPNRGVGFDSLDGKKMKNGQLARPVFGKRIHYPLVDAETELLRF